MNKELLESLPRNILISEVLRLTQENYTLKEQLTEAKINMVEAKAEVRGLHQGIQLTTPNKSFKGADTASLVYNLIPLTQEYIQTCVKDIKLDHILQGEKGLSEYIVNFPFKDRVICTNKTKKILTYKNEQGTIITEQGDAIILTIAKTIQPSLNKFWEQYCPQFRMQFYGSESSHEYEYSTSDISMKIMRLVEGKKITTNIQYLKKVLALVCQNL
jgi:hypothetical protein